MNHDQRYDINSTKLEGLGWAPEKSLDDILRDAISDSPEF